jgi:hypothetical protein
MVYLAQSVNRIEITPTAAFSKDFCVHFRCCKTHISACQASESCVWLRQIEQNVQKACLLEMATRFNTRQAG